MSVTLKKRIFLVSVRGVFALLLLAATSHAGLCQRPERAELPFAHSEQLFYQAELNRGLLRGFDVGELRFSAKTFPAKDGSSPGMRVVNLVGDAVTKGFLIRLTGSNYHVHVESTAEPNPFKLLHTKSLYEDKHTTINSEAVFDYEARKVVWTENAQNQKPNATTVTFDGRPIHDVLTLIYFVRTQSLKPGHSFEVAMIDNGRTYRCTVNVLAGKKMSTAVGRINTVLVEPAIFDGNREVRPRGILSIWLTDDARHLPVKAQVKAPIGTIDIKLKRVSYREADIAQK